jgi:hypothetical protein
MYSNYDDWLLKACRRAGFKPRIVKEADGAASALAFVAAGYGVAVVSEPLQKIPAKDVMFRNLALEDRAWVPVGAAWKPDAISAPVASQFIDVLAQSCANGNGKRRASWKRSIELMTVDFTNNVQIFARFAGFSHRLDRYACQFLQPAQIYRWPDGELGLGDSFPSRLPGSVGRLRFRGSTVRYGEDGLMRQRPNRANLVLTDRYERPVSSPGCSQGFCGDMVPANREPLVSTPV